MSSSDEEAPTPQLGASSSKDRPPVAPMVSESDDDDVVIKKSRKNKRPRDASCFKDRAQVTPEGSESDDGDDSAKKKARKYKRPRVLWETVVSIAKGAEAEMDDDERKEQIAQGARAFMEAEIGRASCRERVSSPV